MLPYPLLGLKARPGSENTFGWEKLQAYPLKFLFSDHMVIQELLVPDALALPAHVSSGAKRPNLRPRPFEFWELIPPAGMQITLSAMSAKPAGLWTSHADMWGVQMTSGGQRIWWKIL